MGKAHRFSFKGKGAGIIGVGNSGKLAMPKAIRVGTQQDF